MTTNKPAKRGVVALRLNLGGAPSTWHTITTSEGLPAPGLFHPTIPTPIADLGLDDEQTNTLLNNVPLLERVEITEEEAHDASLLFDEALGKSRRGVKKAARTFAPTETARIHDEHNATQSVARKDGD